MDMSKCYFLSIINFFFDNIPLLQGVFMKKERLLILTIATLFLTNCNTVEDAISEIKSQNVSVASRMQSDTLYPTSIKQTGQTISYALDGTEVTDGSIKDDGYYQTGDIREFIKSSDGIEDISSGLIWQASSSEKELTLSEAKEYCENLEINGLNSYRLPTAKELQELVNYQKRGPSLDSEFTDIKSGVDSIGYWSSSNSKGFALWSSFNTGNDHFYTTQSNKHYVKCVDATNSKRKSANFARDNSGIVLDYNSKLSWQDNTTVDSKNWKEAIDYCEALTLGGYNDWRLPNISELSSIIDLSSSTKLDSTFKSTLQKVYWSSTSHVASSKISWGINFAYGTNSYHPKKEKKALRCVRGGKFIAKIR
jgi:predicted small secreted protein